MVAIPAVLHLHRARLQDDDVETIDGVRVTTTLRTLVDVIADNTLSHDLQGQAVYEAIKRGLVLPEQVASAQTSVRTRQRIRRILKQVPYGDATAVHDRDSASHGS
jgi:hypothetical protein